jgi:hypothetical protein
MPWALVTGPFNDLDLRPECPQISMKAQKLSCLRALAPAKKMMRLWRLRLLAYTLYEEVYKINVSIFFLMSCKIWCSNRKETILTPTLILPNAQYTQL